MCIFMSDQVSIERFYLETTLTLQPAFQSVTVEVLACVILKHVSVGSTALMEINQLCIHHLQHSSRGCGPTLLQEAINACLTSAPTQCLMTSSLCALTSLKCPVTSLMYSGTSLQFTVTPS